MPPSSLSLAPQVTTSFYHSHSALISPWAMREKKLVIQKTQPSPPVFHQNRARQRVTQQIYRGIRGVNATARSHFKNGWNGVVMADLSDAVRKPWQWNKTSVIHARMFLMYQRYEKLWQEHQEHTMENTETRKENKVRLFLLLPSHPLDDILHWRIHVHKQFMMNCLCT